MSYWFFNLINNNNNNNNNSAEYLNTKNAEDQFVTIVKIAKSIKCEFNN